MVLSLHFYFFLIRQLIISPIYQFLIKLKYEKSLEINLKYDF